MKSKRKNLKEMAKQAALKDMELENIYIFQILKNLSPKQKYKSGGSVL